jgi:hypothetical protein
MAVKKKKRAVQYKGGRLRANGQIKDSKLNLGRAIFIPLYKKLPFLRTGLIDSILQETHAGLPLRGGVASASFSKGELNLAAVCGIDGIRTRNFRRDRAVL